MFDRHLMKIPAATILSMLLLGITACSSEQLYNAAQEVGRQQCDQLKALPERQRCLNERGVPYDSYKREREKATSQP